MTTFNQNFYDIRENSKPVYDKNLQDEKDTNGRYNYNFKGYNKLSLYPFDSNKFSRTFLGFCEVLLIDSTITLVLAISIFQFFPLD